VEGPFADGPQMFVLHIFDDARSFFHRSLISWFFGDVIAIFRVQRYVLFATSPNYI
jgi:hypothetical protein